jgi:hypothetical protein
LQRIKEYLEILCTCLERVEGLIYEDYIPETAANKKWKPAPDSVVSYGEAAGTCCWQLTSTATVILAKLEARKGQRQQPNQVIFGEWLA